MLEPKLMPEQFDKKGQASVSCVFAGRSVTIVYENPKRLDPGKAKVVSVADEQGEIPATLEKGVAVIEREVFLRRSSPTITVKLG